MERNLSIAHRSKHDPVVRCSSCNMAILGHIVDGAVMIDRKWQQGEDGVYRINKPTGQRVVQGQRKNTKDLRSLKASMVRLTCPVCSSVQFVSAELADKEKAT